MTSIADKKQYTLDDLLYLMARLRKPVTGCPWDLKQNYLSITPSTIEEAYEVVDAIERADYVHLEEELGDLLFQVVFYAQLAKEDRHFDFSAIVDTLTTKLLRRHPHVFPDGTLQSEVNPDSNALGSAQVGERWDQIKDSERKEKGQKGLLDDVPKALPALQRAQKMQKRAAKVGMDWQSIEGTLDKLQEEICELKVAIGEGDANAIHDELGDLMFSCVNVARHLKLDADHALRSANNKFEQRIDAMSELINVDHKQWSELDDDQRDVYWLHAKESLNV